MDNELVTKGFLRETLNEVLNKVLGEQRVEFQRYVSIVSEEFQSKLQVVAEMVRQNTDDVKGIKERLDGNNERMDRMEDKMEIKMDDHFHALKDAVFFGFNNHERRIFALENA